jgi:hypothetical protein
LDWYSVEKAVQFEGNLFCFFSPRAKKKETPPHKTAHLQIAQANPRPKFAKELFSCPRTRS